MSRVGFALLFLFPLAALLVSAQDQPPAPQTAPSAKASGVVRTPNGVSVPGANLRLVETSTGRAWISWTDENGRFDLPGLPLGHYRIEVSQLGFENAAQEFDLSETPGTVNVTVKVASLASLEAAAASAQSSSQTPAGAGAPANPTANAPEGSNNKQVPGQGPGAGGLRRRQFPEGGRAPGAQNGAAEQGAAGPGGPGVGRQGFGGRRGGFQQVILNNQADNQGGTQGQQGETSQEAEGGTSGDQGGDQGSPGGPLGQASASDAFLMNGTVGQGDRNAGSGGGFPPDGVILQRPGDTGQNGFGGPGGGFRGGAPVANPGGAGGQVIALRPSGGGR